MTVTYAEVSAGAAFVASSARAELQRAMYLGVYAGGYRGGRRPAAPFRPRTPEDHAFVSGLSQRVPAEVAEVASRVADAPDGSVVAVYQGVRVAFAPADVECLVDSEVRFRLPAVRVGRSPGFLHRTGGLAKDIPITRIYLNVIPPDAWAILGPAFEALQAAGIECDAKVLAHPSNYFRADSAVIYVPAEAEMRALRIVRRIVDAHEVRLDKHVPALTKRISRGIAIADEPSDLAEPGEMSHGQWVTKILAEAVEGCDDVDTIARRIAELIRRDGRDPTQPYRRGTGPVTQPIG